MAYDSRNLSVVGYANGFTLWHYASIDLATAIDGAGYFNDAANMLRVGDFVLANVDTDGTPLHGMFVVLSNDGAIVDTSDMTAFGATDTD